LLVFRSSPRAVSKLPKSFASQGDDVLRGRRFLWVAEQAKSAMALNGSEPPLGG
jgi:hypothetical protein